MVVLTKFPLNSLIWLREKTEGLTVNDQKCNKAMAAAAVTVVVPLLEQITKFTSTVCTAVGLSTVFFSVSVQKAHQKQLPLNWQGH